MLLPLETARELLRHLEWADARTWAAVLTGEATRSDPNIRSYLHHTHTVQQAFLAMWTGEPVETVLRHPLQDFADARSIRDWARPYYARAQGYLDAADEAALSRPLVMPWVAEYERQLGMTFAVPTVGETIFQVTNHTTHHRAQVLARIRALGGEPPMVDYIAWVWFGKPPADWDEVRTAASE